MEKETEATENELQFIDESEQVLGAEQNENRTVACTLQCYLLGSTIGVPETTTGKKEHRTSLGELFQKTKMAEENSGLKYNRIEKQKERDADKSVVHLMKVYKILHLFHRKVHSETTTKSQNHSKYLRNGTYVNEEGHKRRNQMLSVEDISIFLETKISKKGANNTSSNMPQGPCSASDSNGTRECWIKSDADC